LGGEGFEGEGAKRGEGLVGDDDVSGVVEDGAVGGGGFHGRVGFDEESVGGDGAEMGEARGEAGSAAAKRATSRRGVGGRAVKNGVGMKRRGAGGRSRTEGEGASQSGAARGGASRGAKAGTVAGVMSAAEIIELIEKLPVAEQEQVRVYLEKKTATGETAGARRMELDEEVKIGEGVFDRHPELFRRLAQ
jgi:hypothetical protein